MVRIRDSPNPSRVIGRDLVYKRTKGENWPSLEEGTSG